MAKYDKQASDLAALSADGSVVKHIHNIHTKDASKQYRRLRQFSGSDKLQGGELPYDTWLQLAEQLLLEEEVSAAAKKTRILESLLPPALGVVRKLPITATAQECLDALSKVFGVACDGEDLYGQFRDMYQEASEGPSAYLTRLETQLDRVVRYDGLEEAQADKARLNQFIRGCLYDTDLVGVLQLRQRRSTPPSYIALLQEVRQEEAAEVLRRKQRGKAKKMVAVNAQAVESAASTPPSALEKEVEELKQMVRDMSAQMSKMTTTTSASSRRASRPHGRRDGRPILCYQCGEPGHIMRECPNSASPGMAQRGMTDPLQRRQGNGRGRPQRSNPVPYDQ